GPASLRRDPPSSGRCCRRAGTPSSFACGRSACQPSRGGLPRGPRRPCRRGRASWCRSRLLWKQLPFVHSRSKGCQKDNRSIRPALFKNGGLSPSAETVFMEGIFRNGGIEVLHGIAHRKGGWAQGCDKSRGCHHDPPSFPL